MDKKIKLSLKKIKPEYLIIVCAVVAVMILFFSSFAKNEQKSDYGVNEYVTMLETKLSNRLSELDGAGKVKVIISVKSGLKSEIATEKQVSGIGGGKTTETPVLVSGKPLVLGEI